MDIGAFVLGILFGWLIEWIYVNFFGNKKSDGLGDCSSYERELETRNNEIKALKAELGTVSGAGASLMSSSAGESSAKSESMSTKAVSASDSLSSKTANKATTSSKSTTTKKDAAKTSKSAAKTTAKKAVTKKAATAKKPASTAKKATAAKSAAKKPGSKKIALKKNIGKKTNGDDFTKLSGIGPSMAAKLNELDITTFDKLAGMDDDILRDMLEEAGARLNNNKEDMDTWNEQATLAAKGDFEGLKAFQEKLKK